MTLFASAYCSWVASLVRLLFRTTLFSFFVCSLLRVSAEIHSFCWVFFISRTSSRPCLFYNVATGCRHACFFPVEGLDEDNRCCKRRVGMSLVSPRSCHILVLLCTPLVFIFNFNLACIRWWSDMVDLFLGSMVWCYPSCGLFCVGIRCLRCDTVGIWNTKFNCICS